MHKDARIYVAGHRGLVGSAILQKLKTEGYSNLIIRSHSELDLIRQSKVESFFQDKKPEYVFLAAAKVGGIFANSTYPAEFIYDNLSVQTNVIHAAWRTGAKRLIFLGSSCIYPGVCPQPMKEEDLLAGPLEKTNEAYAIAKIVGIKMCQSYNRQYSTRFLPVMPTNLYGPNDNYDLENSHVLPALIRKFHLARLAASGDWQGIQKDENKYGTIPVEFRSCLISISTHNGHQSPYTDPQPDTPPAVILWGSGKPHREFLHVDDFAEACFFLMNLDGHTFQRLLTDSLSPLINIGCGKDSSIRELAVLTQKIIGFQGEIIYDTGKPDGTFRKLLDISKMEALGWRPRIELKNGIEKTYQQYLKR